MSIIYDALQKTQHTRKNTVNSPHSESEASWVDYLIVVILACLLVVVVVKYYHYFMQTGSPQKAQAISPIIKK